MKRGKKNFGISLSKKVYLLVFIISTKNTKKKKKRGLSKIWYLEISIKIRENAIKCSGSHSKKIIIRNWNKNAIIKENETIHV